MKLRRRELLPIVAFFCIVPVSAALLPISTLDPQAVQIYSQYVARFETAAQRVFGKDGTLWIDGQPAVAKEFAAGRSFTETRAIVNCPAAQIHHLFGTIRLQGLTIASATAVMQSYSRYPEFFRPDIVKGRSQEFPDSKPALKHFQVFLELVQSTAWLDVAFETSYETRYELLENHRATITSRSIYIHEFRDAHHLDQGTLAEGADHGFLWRTYTSWHMREREGGLDLELNSISLSRPVPFGFGWWANRTARGAVDKMINHTADAIRKNAPGQTAQD